MFASFTPAASARAIPSARFPPNAFAIVPAPLMRLCICPLRCCCSAVSSFVFCVAYDVFTAYCSANRPAAPMAVLVSAAAFDSPCCAAASRVVVSAMPLMMMLTACRLVAAETARFSDAIHDSVAPFASHVLYRKNAMAPAATPISPSWNALSSVMPSTRVAMNSETRAAAAARAGAREARSRAARAASSPISSGRNVRTDSTMLANFMKNGTTPNPLATSPVRIIGSLPRTVASSPPHR